MVVAIGADNPVSYLLSFLAVAFATGYRLYFSRAVALTQVCERIEMIQNDETADVFQLLAGDAAKWLKDINQLCEVRRPMKESN